VIFKFDVLLFSLITTRLMYLVTVQLQNVVVFSNRQ